MAVVSAALLAYQIVLLHLLAIRHWTHFAALVIGLALLGFGASGSLLALLRPRLAGRERQAFVLAAVLAALSFDPAYRLSAAIPFDAFELLAVPRQALWLTLTYVVLSVPFLLGAAAIALGFEIAPRDVARVYAANLLGSGVGAALGLLLLGLLPAERLPAAVALVAALALVPLGRGGLLAPLAVAALALLLPPPPIPMSSYKDESLALSQPEARLLARRDGPLGRLDVVAAPTLRYLPGASLALSEPVPPRPVLYRDGQPLGFRARVADADLIGMTTQAAATALPRAVAARDDSVEVLVIGLGGGAEVLHALASGAERVTVVDPDRRLDPLLAPGVLGPRVERVALNARAFLHATDRVFDAILLSEVGSLGGLAAGMGAAGEDYLLTRQGLRDLWRALEPDGVLSVTRWMLQPPRDLLRLLATARDVLEGAGLDPARHVALVRGWGTATLLVSRAPLTARRVAALRRWSEERWFDLTWAPGVTAEEANRFNIVEPDLLRRGAERLLAGDRRAADEFVESYPFRIAPVTDDAPFFHHFLPLAELPRLWREEGRMALPYVEWGLVAQVLALAQAVPVAAVLILLPLLFLPRRRRGGVPDPAEPNGTAGAGIPGAAVLFAYFALLGVAYMLLEIAFLQRLVLFLAQPVYAATAVLTAFLLFAGLGSAVAPRVGARAPWAPFAAVAVLAPLAYVAQGVLWDHAAGAPLAFRVVAAVVVLAPLAFAMGMPFPLGLQRVAAARPEWLPWCWGVNGFLSVVGAALAPLLALGVGFRGVIVAAGVLYVVAGLALRRLAAVA